MKLGFGIGPSGLVALGRKKRLRDLFRPSDLGFHIDAANAASLFQDIGGTSPATVLGQSIALWRDLSGRGQHLTQASLANRPFLARIPANGLRNVAHGSAAVADTAYWPSGSSSNGITVTKVGSGTEGGLPYADYSVTGTASAISAINSYAFANSRTPTVPGAVWTASVIVRLIGGTAPPANCGVRMDIAEETAPSTYRNGTLPSPSVPGTDTALTTTRTISDPLSNQIRAAIVIRTEAGATVNYTVRLKALQFETGNARTAFQQNLSPNDIVETGFGTLPAIRFDGLADVLSSPVIAWGRDEVTLAIAFRKNGDATRGMLAELGSAASNAFSLEAPSAAAAEDLRFASGGSLGQTGIALASGQTSPRRLVALAQGKIGSDLAILRINGVQQASGGADQGTGTYGNLALSLGARSGAALPANAYVFAALAINRQLSAAEVNLVEASLMDRAGL